jgi:hypothetical protein
LTKNSWPGAYSCDQIQTQLPPELRARREERVFVTGVAAPFVVEFSDLRLTETYVEIVDASSGNRIVSMLEFLSPTNKFAG